ncbi:hypothetical protein PSACC_01257 [Paramicrosporidium saccamoebae]|uniref:SprT-like domain-containing protein n=1 Tax=Paramicrosporidium saccamoebae TaxID=1246581 RepID=A0A2H9TMI3_9FUNG|nr:hypothetical protein PSACC_01257 [Paramicrosporidium saccamoebae]
MSLPLDMVENLPDVHTLFAVYNGKYFENVLGATTLEWSNRMTLCAGLCYLRRMGTARYCVIRLSRPLLQYRPYSDTISTLLHEMLHAYLWVKGMGGNGLDRDGHGPEFLRHAARINKAEGSAISVFHTFHEAVQEARKHVWKCNGPCVHRAPYYGIVQRAMNRPPQPADRWWREHQKSCGGSFVKIAGPESKKRTTKALDYWSRLGKGNLARDDVGGYQCPSCRDHMAADLASLKTHLNLCNRKQCPVCGVFQAMNLLDDHIDACLGETNTTLSALSIETISSTDTNGQSPNNSCSNPTPYIIDLT